LEFEIVPKLEMTEEPGYGPEDRSLPLPFYTRDPTPICPFKDSQIGEELGQIHPIRRGLFEKPHERENEIEVKETNIRYSGDDPRRRAVVGRSSNACRLRVHTRGRSQQRRRSGKNSGKANNNRSGLPRDRGLEAVWEAGMLIRREDRLESGRSRHWWIIDR
jgi:hypothetical protein